MAAEAPESTPIRSLVEELEKLRTVLRETTQSYADRIDSEVLAVQETVKAQMPGTKISPSQLRDIRDMITLLRHTDIKTEKGRRKDLRKIDGVVGDLQMLTENW